MKRILIVGIVGVLGTVVVLSGCSSDNGVARPLSTTLRAVQVGDYYEYTIRGSATHPDVEPEDAPPVSGTVRVSVSNSELRILNEPILRFEYITTLRIGTELRESRFALHYLQGRNPRDLLLIAYEDTQGQIQPITPQIIAVPGLWSAGYSRSYSEPFVYSFIITGQDVVNTPLGKFTTWRCYVRSQVPMDDPIENAVRTVWYAPEIGMPVAVQLTTTIVVGQQTWTVSLHQQLSFTTVPIPDTNL
ncbi:MAG: hypothetical protein KatS3mg016_1925 [Fimbriimonadales bacterium]|nr:MAG: hypothetical protein KatS3mg016_1925 [Fimbriimonadales bacterium]